MHGWIHGRIVVLVNKKKIINNNVAAQKMEKQCITILVGFDVSIFMGITIVESSISSRSKS